MNQQANTHDPGSAANSSVSLRYKFTPAQNPKKAPLLVLFHGWGGQPYGWSHPEWNVLAPWDCFGYARNGCWWLGEDGNYFMPQLLDTAIKQTMSQYGFKPDIFCWGTSMGGFGALFHGLRWKAKAICANVPQVNIQNTDYYSRNTKLIDKVFGNDTKSQYADITNFINGSDPTKNPMFFITQSRFDMYEKYTSEQCFHLIDCLNKYNINYSLSIVPVKGHLVLMGPDEALNIMLQNKEAILQPLTF